MLGEDESPNKFEEGIMMKTEVNLEQLISELRSVDKIYYSYILELLIVLKRDD